MFDGEYVECVQSNAAGMFLIFIWRFPCLQRQACSYFSFVAVFWYIELETGNDVILWCSVYNVEPATRCKQSRQFDFILLFAGEWDLMEQDQRPLLSDKWAWLCLHLEVQQSDWDDITFPSSLLYFFCSWPELKTLQNLQAHSSNCISIEFDPQGK